MSFRGWLPLAFSLTVLVSGCGGGGGISAGTPEDAAKGVDPAQQKDMEDMMSKEMVRAKDAKSAPAKSAAKNNQMPGMGNP